MTLKAAVIGLGVGEAHAEIFDELSSCELIAICDFDEAKRKESEGKYSSNPRIVQDPNDILLDPEIDVVSICSWDPYHHDQIIAALENKKHIFVEKPLCNTADEARNIRKALESAPELKISSNLILRRSPRFLRVKELIESDELGDVFYIEGDYNYGRLSKLRDGWRGKMGFYSVVLGGGVHMIDLMMWHLNDPIVEVSALGNNRLTEDSEFENFDMVVSTLKFESGRIGKLAVNFGCVYPHFHRYSVYGSKASFENGLQHGSLFTQRDAREHDHRQDGSDPKQGVQEIDDAYPGVHKGDLIADFIEAIVEGREPAISRDDVFRGLSVCFAIEESAHSGKPVAVEYL